MTTLSATTLRLALIDYRAELLRRGRLFPNVYDGNNHHPSVYDIDQVLYEIEGNCTTVSIAAHTCNPNP